VTLRSDAAARGFTVRDDGSVLAPPVPPVMSSPEQAAEVARRQEQRARELQAEAERIAAAVGRALQDAATADEALATVLAGLEVPESLRADVDSLLQRLANGEDLWGALAGVGTLGGGAVVVKSLLGAWKTFGKTAAYGTYLSNAVRAALGAGPALRWLTTGTGDAAAWARTVQAIDRMNDARQTFQIGKTPTWLAGVRSTAGKAFLPLTVLSGGMDVVTGGGYDGARGVTTRILGGAGALGGAALLTGALASNPIGWTVAAGAVLAYSAWSAGNFVYDHWDDITEFGGRALDWGHDLVTDPGRTLSEAADWGSERLEDAGEALDDAADWAGGKISGAMDAIGDFSIF
jgi:hypothetical protein